MAYVSHSYGFKEVSSKINLRRKGLVWAHLGRHRPSWRRASSKRVALATMSTGSREGWTLPLHLISLSSWSKRTFKASWSRLKHILSDQNRNHGTMNAFCQQEINFLLHLKKEGDGVHASRFIKLLQGIFCLLLVVESFLSSHQTCWYAWRSGSQREVGWV